MIWSAGCSAKLRADIYAPGRGGLPLPRSTALTPAALESVKRDVAHPAVCSLILLQAMEQARGGFPQLTVRAVGITNQREWPCSMRGAAIRWQLR